MTDRELMQQALDAMGTVGADWICEASHHAKKDRHKLGEPCPLQQRWHIAYQALRERLAQPERTHWEGCEEVHPECRQQKQEAKMLLIDEDTAELVLEALENVTKDYVENRKRTHDRAIEQLYKVFTQKPQRREWVGLKDEEIMEPWPFENRVAFARWLEAKLKEKNNG